MEPGSVFGALADPTRRRIVERLVDAGPTTATRLSGQLDISRQAVAKHLDLLHRAGLAEVERVGREARYRLVSAPLTDAAAWLEGTARAWDGRLDRLRLALDDPG